MDYEKLHKDTINRLQQMVDCGKITVEVARGICADFELESEDADEKIRKALIKLVTNHASMDLFIEYDIHLDEALAWLERQVGQKPEWSKEDEWKFSDILALLRGGENCHYNTPDLFKWLKSLKDRYAWKPNDEQMKELSVAKNSCFDLSYKTKNALKSLYNDLKKLRGK